jgi:hypothetical protein
LQVSTPRPIRESFHVASSDNKASATSTSAFSEELERLAEEFRSRLAEAAGSAEEQLRQDVASRLNEEFDEKFKAGIRMVREEMEQRMEAANAQWLAERQKLIQEIQDLKRLGDTERIVDEIQRTEATLTEAAHQVESMVADASVRLSDVMRKKSEHAELAAYLRGL